MVDQAVPRLLDFSGRTVVVTGTGSGMGAAVLRHLLGAGAEVHALDVRPMSEAGGKAHHHRCDLGRRDSIDAVIRRLPSIVDVVMNCAGVPNGGRFSGADVMRVNWLGLRHLTESLIPRMPPRSAVVHIASTAGRAWADRLGIMRRLMAAHSFEQGEAWLADNPGAYGDGYVLSKEAVQYYTLWRSVQLLPAGIRMNSVCPGVTDTPLVDDFRAGMGADVVDHATAVAGRMARPEEMAPAMLFLADEASASYINGVNLNIDRGTSAARATDQSDPALIWGS